MDQPDSPQYPHGGPPPVTPPVTSAAIGRLAALGGLGFAVASLAGDFTIGAFPRPATPASQLVAFYATHHAQVQAGGMLLAVSGSSSSCSAPPSGPDPADAHPAAAGGPDPDRHCARRGHHADQRGNLRHPRRHRRPALGRPSRRYAGIRGHGTYQLSLEFISARSHGQCASGRPPAAQQELIRLSGPVQL